MTVVFILYAVLLAHFSKYGDSPMVIVTFVKAFPAIGISVGVFCLILSLAVFMYAVRSLWNRIFPKICGWKEIDLAEAYAISMIVAFLCFSP